ncbi:right-handed parallel beta-helix repeat-containing protein [Oceanicella sp. SM1341]|uniref:right-handed parallel beta-helix repeat-containing protein n=1 Tax=Oceanicella sp. SM1341 TaxID=1548889 RepID=UPI000E52E735|nr:right-handed parallel beta-helix repeat-containing protein [Oceanicella sp. SM1341]
MRASAALPWLALLAALAAGPAGTVDPGEAAAPQETGFAAGPPATVHVSPLGDDAGPGTAAAPWASINRAVQAPLPPGSTVILRAGVYTEQVWLTRSGAAGAPLVLRAETPQAALLRPPPGAYSTLNIRANHVRVEDLDISGGTGHGIDVESSHHVTLRGNRVHGSGGAGIQFNYSEFSVAEGNITSGNAGSNGYQTSGISVYQPRNITGDTTTPGYRVVIRGNVSYANAETAVVTDPHTDGNGIIIDDFRSTQSPEHPAYRFPALVEGNLVFLNGGKGIQVTWSDNITLRHNISWHNNLDGLNPSPWRGELSNAQSGDNTWVGNIAVADPQAHPQNRAIVSTSYDGYRNRRVAWRGNLSFDGRPGHASLRTDGGNAAPRGMPINLLGRDPLFVDPPRDFSLRPGSPAPAAEELRAVLSRLPPPFGNGPDSAAGVTD